MYPLVATHTQMYPLVATFLINFRHFEPVFHSISHLISMEAKMAGAILEFASLLPTPFAILRPS
jgi:hypothetical protein